LEEYFRAQKGEVLTRCGITSSDILRRCTRMQLDNWTFGITMLVVGMGGTVLTLWILSLIMGLLKKVFPLSKEENTK
jgi:hypothetical protein